MAEIRKAEKNELRNLIPIYKEIFPVHNVFQQSDQIILKYLENVKGDFLVAVEDGKIVGGLLFVVELSTREHKRARLKHIAVAKDYQGRGIGSALLKKSEELVGKGKIEIHVSENEKDSLDFYKKNSYEIEGELKSHYRPDETAYILGKVI